MVAWDGGSPCQTFLGGLDICILSLHDRTNSMLSKYRRRENKIQNMTIFIMYDVQKTGMKFNNYE